jgi:hypothetical protein
MLSMEIGLWPISAAAGGGAFVPDFYADSAAAGGGNGSAAAPFNTLSALQTAAISFGNGVKIGLKRGSNWRERLNLSALDNVQIADYGTGDLPVIDCAEYPAAGSWSKTGGLTNVYQTTLAALSLGGAQERYHGRENDVSLIVRTTNALVDANAGSMRVDRAGANPIVYVHAFNSSDPASNGRVYDFAVRDNAIDLSGINVTGTHKSGARVTGIVTRGNLHDNGSLMVGHGATVKKCVAAHGSYHSLFIGDGEIEDVVLFDKHSVINSGSQLVGYFNSTAQKTLTARRLYLIGIPDTGTYETCEGSFCHVDGGGKYTLQTIEQWAAINLSGSIDLANTDAATMRGGYIKNSAAPLTPVTPTLFEYIQMNGVYISTARWIVPGSTLRHIASYNGSPFGILNGVNIERSTFHTASPPGPGSQTALSMVNNRNILIGSATSANPEIRCTKSGYVGNYNIYHHPIDATRSVWFIDEAGANFFTLASWQAATGQDAQSVRLTTAQLASFWMGDPSLGDFRINPNAQVTDAVGNVHTGTFPDGTPLTYAGCQEHWDWSAGISAAGAPTAWPNIPDTYAEALAYCADPEAWTY